MQPRKQHIKQNQRNQKHKTYCAKFFVALAVFNVLNTKSSQKHNTIKISNATKTQNNKNTQRMQLRTHHIKNSQRNQKTQHNKTTNTCTKNTHLQWTLRLYLVKIKLAEQLINYAQSITFMLTQLFSIRTKGIE